MDKGVEPKECDMRCQWAYFPVWHWCMGDCVCVCKGKNHAMYTFWAKPENVAQYQVERI